jgi:hypothetical protein
MHALGGRVALFVL